MLKVESSGTAHSLKLPNKTSIKIAVELNAEVQNPLEFSITVRLLYVQVDLSLLSPVVQALL